MKKLIAIMLSGLCIVSVLSGCNEQHTDSPDPTPETTDINTEQPSSNEDQSTETPTENATQTIPEDLDFSSYVKDSIEYPSEYKIGAIMRTKAEIGKDTYLQIAAWDNQIVHISVPAYYSCGQVIEDQAWFFCLDSRKFLQIYKLTKGNNTPVLSEIELPVAMDNISLFCDYTEDGTLFVDIVRNAETENGSNKYNQLSYQLTSRDMGSSWELTILKNAPVVTDDYTFAQVCEHLDANTALISYYNVSSALQGGEAYPLCDRTFVTTDGGATWQNIQNIPIPDDRDNTIGNVDFVEKVDGRYLLHVVFTTWTLEGPTHENKTYESENLKSWTLID